MSRISLASGGIRTPERLEALRREMRDLFAGCARLLFVPFAVADHDSHTRAMQERGFAAGFELLGIHRAADAARAVAEAEGIYVGGGNSFRLLAEVQARGLLEPIRARVAAGAPYLGISAGTNLACPSIRTANDMPIAEPPQGLGALGLIGFQVNPHFVSGPARYRNDAGEWEEYAGETREDRIAEFHERHALPVLGLREGAILRVRGSARELASGGARLFRRGRPPEDLAAPCELPADIR